MIPHQARPFLVMLFMVGLIMLVAGLTEGCGPSSRDKALSETLLSVNAARDGFLAWDKQHQDAIVAACTPDTGCTLEKGQAQLDAYRVKRAPVEEAFTIAYQAIALAAVNGKTPLPTILSAAKDLLDSIEGLEHPATNPLLLERR